MFARRLISGHVVSDKRHKGGGRAYCTVVTALAILQRVLKMAASSVQLGSPQLYHRRAERLLLARRCRVRPAPRGGLCILSAMVPRPLVICGPSGSGKSTLLKYLMDEFGDCFGFSVSHTTRKPRAGEKSGREYHFITRNQMEQAIRNGEFLEYTEFSGNLYGTSKKAVQDVQKQGRICILDIEIDGVRNIKKTELNPRYVFIKPPSLEVLEQRLKNRGSETEDSLRCRLARAEEELQYGDSPGNFDLILTNDKVEETYKHLRKFLMKDLEELRLKMELQKGHLPHLHHHSLVAPSTKQHRVVPPAGSPRA